MFNEIQSALKSQFQLNQISLVPLKTPLTIEFYRKWLNQNYYGDMAYLETHYKTKKNPFVLGENLNSVITVTQQYFPLVQPLLEKTPARIALYAQNQDYHYWLKEKLTALIQELKQKYPHDHFLPYVDSGPLLEKDISYQAGHGWFGKNSCLIHPKDGSLFFIAEILTTLNSPSETITLQPDLCGKCTRCIDSCPTQAIIAPKTVQADKCISYHTIESKSVPPLELRSKINDWFFGCDICQTVCPWNEKAFRINSIPSSNLTSTQEILQLNKEQNEELISFLKEILTSSNKKLQKKFWGTALLRSAGFGLKRNALIVIANRKINELQPEVRLFLKDPKLSELAEWCLNQLN